MNVLCSVDACRNFTFINILGIWVVVEKPGIEEHNRLLNRRGVRRGGRVAGDVG